MELIEFVVQTHVGIEGPMARIVKPLTATQVKQAKPLPKDYELSDGGGLLLRVRTCGTKAWILKYQKPYTKKRTNLALGSYPEVTLAIARNKRDEAKALLSQEIDPKEHRNQQSREKASAHSQTFRAVALQWFNVKRTEVSPSFSEGIWRSFEAHLFPALGPIPVHQLNAPTVIQALKPVEAKGSLETLRRLCQRINEVMTFATNTGLIHHNPLAGIKAAFQTPPKQNMPTLKPERLPELLQTIANASIKRTTRCLIEWQLHTMVRPSEAAGARWDEIDLAQKLWTIPAERMKKKRPHIVPLTPQTLALLEVMKPISAHREYIFPADRAPNRHTNPSTANMALKRMGFHGELVAHGLRALASTTLNEQGFDPELIEVALAHSDKNQVRAAYNRSEYIERRRKMMAWWSLHIEEASRGNTCLASQKLLSPITHIWSKEAMK